MVDFKKLLEENEKKTEEEKREEEVNRQRVVCVICDAVYEDPLLDNKKILHQRGTGHDKWRSLDYSEYLELEKTWK